MKNLFNKVAVCTDLHIGAKNNSIVHNDDCLNFIKWFIETAHSEGCETAIICGDWHNHRASINVLSLNYSMQCLELLNDAFTDVYFLTGNHDLFYRENRNVNSVAWGSYLRNIHVINEIITDSGVTLCPWLVGDEYKQVKKLNTQYVFGHLELPHFYMNSMVLLPEHGEFNHTWFQGCGNVFSGHFHKRQTRDNITYIGNCFPHNYGDAGDTQRGMMILEWGGVPVYKSWDGQPTFHVLHLSDVVSRPTELLKPHSYNRVVIDVEISYEEANFLKETLVLEHQLREFALIPRKRDLSEADCGVVDLKFEGVDQLVTGAINNIESGSFDKQLLLEIYRDL